jgi:hypothetical protein
MDFRFVKRAVCLSIASDTRHRRDNMPAFGDQKEHERWHRAFTELAEELDRRGGRPPSAEKVDPDQLHLFVESE